MSTLVELVISAIGGGGIALTVAAYLGRRFMDIQVAKAVAIHKAELAQRTEALKTELSIYAHEQTVGLSRIDAQRSEGILSVWKLLSAWNDSFIQLTMPHPVVDKNPQVAVRQYEAWGREMLGLTDKLSREVRDPAILFDAASYDAIANFGQAIGNLSADFYKAAFGGMSPDANVALAQIDEARANLEKGAGGAVGAFQGTLVTQFRLLMSAERR